MDSIYIILAVVMSTFVLYQESIYKVKNDDQVVIIQFGKAFGEAITEPGMFFKIREAERKIMTATEVGDIVYKSNDTTTEDLECNAEVLHRVKKEAQFNLLEFGILLLYIKATVTY
ncbi:MAG: hypothetical protein JSV38_12705 [Desulfobacterales bacterium]|nr:MAG: hypothetical protein JSV38_12705 [Desulfobacterales bacterium]